MLKLLGVDPRRLHLKWISASEGAIFAEEIRAFVQFIKELGPGPFERKDVEATEAIETATA